MDFFTQTVDSSLWTSRTYEDPEYDGDEASAAISRLPWTASPDINVDMHSMDIECLIVATGPDAIRAVEASLNLDANSDTYFVSGDNKVPVSIMNTTTITKTAVVIADVADSMASSLAQAVLGALRPRRALVLTSCAQWALRGRPDPGAILWMRTTTTTTNNNSTAGEKNMLCAPSFLTGCAAAFIAEGELTRRSVSAAVLVKEGITACYSDLKLLRDTALEFAPQDIRSDSNSNSNIILSEAAFEAEVRKQLKSERANEPSMYM